MAKTTRTVIDGDIIDMRLDSVTADDMIDYSAMISTPDGRQAQALESLAAELEVAGCPDQVVARQQRRADLLFARARRSIRRRPRVTAIATRLLLPRARCRQRRSAAARTRGSTRASASDDGGEPGGLASDFLYEFHGRRSGQNPGSRAHADWPALIEVLP